jgi:hypothetical protein
MNSLMPNGIRYPTKLGTNFLTGGLPRQFLAGERVLAQDRRRPTQWGTQWGSRWGTQWGSRWGTQWGTQWGSRGEHGGGGGGGAAGAAYDVRAACVLGGGASLRGGAGGAGGARGALPHVHPGTCTLMSQHQLHRVDESTPTAPR